MSSKRRRALTCPSPARPSPATCTLQALLARRRPEDPDRVTYGSGGGPGYNGQFTPLVLAVSEHHPEAVQELIKFKADPNGRGQSRNPINFKALWDTPTLKALLEGGGSRTCATNKATRRS